MEHFSVTHDGSSYCHISSFSVRDETWKKDKEDLWLSAPLLHLWFWPLLACSVSSDISWKATKSKHHVAGFILLFHSITPCKRDSQTAYPMTTSPHSQDSTPPTGWSLCFHFPWVFRAQLLPLLFLRSASWCASQFHDHFNSKYASNLYLCLMSVCMCNNTSGIWDTSSTAHSRWCT